MITKQFPLSFVFHLAIKKSKTESSEFTNTNICETYVIYLILVLFKDTLSGPRQFLATGSPLRVMKNVFYFTSESLFVLKIFKFLS